MTTAYELLEQKRRDEIWKKYIGFIDLNLDEFMDIQRRLLLEQINLLSKSKLGQELFKGNTPGSIEEFQERVPLTTYSDYSRYLDKQDESCLPVKPRWWLRTSGRTGIQGANKWAPYTPLMVKKLGETVLALFTLAACSKPGEFPFDVGDRMLYTMAPFPYMSGGVSRAILEEFPFTFLPPLERAEAMDFQERIQEGLNEAITGGMDAMNAIAIVLIRIAEQFTQGTGKMSLKPLVTNPTALIRLLKGFIRSRIAGRKQLYPKDIWTIKGIATGGTDTVVFRDKIMEFWGKSPVEAYGCTESNLLALQLWEGRSMTFLPDISFLEFLPFEEYLKNQENPSYQPKPVLLNEVKIGGIYEMVTTNFHGGAFVRYQVGDFIKIVSLQHEELNVKIPQMVFHAKTSDIIDISSICRLTEKIIWQSIENAGIKYNDWTARKEFINEKPCIVLYIELKEQGISTNGLEKRVYNEICTLDHSFGDLKDMFEIEPLRVNLLPSGAFGRFYRSRVNAGADLAHLKPSHINASDGDIDFLMG